MESKFIEEREKLISIMFEINQDQRRMTRDELENKYKSFAEKHPKTWLNLMKDFTIILKKKR